MAVFTRLARWTFMAVAILVIVAAGALIAAQTEWGENRARGFLLSRANNAFAGKLDIGRLDYSLNGRAVAENVTLTHLGETVFSAERVEVSYRPWRVLTMGVGLELVSITKPVVRLIEGPDGWNVTSLMRERERKEPSNASIQIDALQLRDATVEIRPLRAPARRLVDLVLVTDLSYAGGELRMNVTHGTGRDPDANVWIEQLRTRLTVGGGQLAFDDISTIAAGSQLTGSYRMGISGRRDLAIDIHAAPLDARQVAKYAPAFSRLQISPAIDLTATGTLDNLSGRIRLQSNAGNVTSQFTGGTTPGGLRLRGDADVDNLNLAQWLGRPTLASRITGRGNFDLTTSERRSADAPLPYRVAFDGRFPVVAVAGYEAQQVDTRGVVDNGVVTARATGVAYGTSVKTDARWDTDRAQLTAKGEFSSLDLRRLPKHLEVPALESHAAGTYDVFVDVDARAGARRSTWRADVTMADSTVEGARIGQGFTAFIDATQPVLAYRIKGPVGGLEPARFTRAFPEPPAWLGKFEGMITGLVELEGSGTTAENANTTAKVDLRDSVIWGVNVSAMTASASLTNRRLVADVRADFAGATHQTFGLNDQTPFRAAGHALIHAQVADITAPLRADLINGTADVTLSAAEVRGIAVDSLALQAALQDGLATIAKLEVASPAARISASGALALEGAGQSDFGFQINVSDAAAFSELAGRPLEGSLALDGRVSGTAQSPTASGKYTASRIAVANVSALSAAGTFDVAVSDRNFRQPRLKATTDASFVEVGDTEIRSVTGTVTHDGVRMDVDAALEQTGRSLRLAGSMIPHPDHREIHVTNLALRAGETEWRTPTGQDAVIQWGENRLDLKNLQFERNDARIRLDGRLGMNGASSAEPLVVTLERVRLEDFTTLMLSHQKLAGQIDGTARITGDLKSPNVAADVAIVNGSVNGVAFDRLAGQTTWRENVLGVDVRLDAGASGTLTAKGSVPLGPASAELPPYNLRVQSDAVNLAFFQPLASHVEKLTGTGRFNITVGGTSKAPTFTGDLGITGASLTLTATGIDYHGLEMRAKADGTNLNIEEFRILDPDDHAATIAGSLRIADFGAPTGFNLRLTGREFHILNNAFGEVALSPDLRFSGDLAAPLVVGTILVDRGRVEISDILERFGATGYRSAEPSGAEKVEAAAQATRGPLAGASFSIALDFQDRLNVRGRDIRTRRGSIGLGDANITLGGALTIAKNPDEPFSLVGEVSVVRGNYAFQGRRFTILPNSVLRFAGTNFTNPSLDVSAERQIGGVTANVHVAGTIREPQLTLSSSPPLDQGDVLSLIVFNQPMNQLPTAQRVSLATRAGTLAARALATPIADSVARALDFDVFEIAPTEDIEGGAVLTVGRQINDKLFVGFRQQFGSEDSSQVSFEYRLNEFLRIVTSFAQGTERSRTLPRAERAAADFIFVIRR